MITGIKINKSKSIVIDDKFSVFSKPKIVYIPLISGNDTNITVLVKKGEYVFKGSEVGRRKGPFTLPIHSSVSGRVIGFEEKTGFYGDKVKCVVIENDFAEKTDNKSIIKNISDITKKEFIEIIKNAGIKGMGGADFPTYVKYQTDKKIKTLIVNAVECEPYLTADKVLFNNKCEEILECIDAILEINNIDEAYIAIKNNNYRLKQLIETFVGTYPKIKIALVPNLYPMGWEKSLVKFIKKTDYENIPIEKGIIVNNVSTIYAIYGALKTRKPLIERIITFKGSKTSNVLVRVGTKVIDIINSIGEELNDTKEVIAGGPMMGIVTDVEDLVVTSNLTGILILPKINFKFETECLRCGKCVYACPAKISPVLIRDYIDNDERLKNLNVNKCVECGLCSYVCPAKINVRSYVKEAKEKMRGVDNESK